MSDFKDILTTWIISQDLLSQKINLIDVTWPLDRVSHLKLSSGEERGMF